MVFSSHVFVFYFLALSLAAYYAAPVQWRHPVLTALSYVFYGWWNPWFVLLMAAGTVIDYYCGRIISGAQTTRRKKLGLWLSVTSNLLILGFFKYTGFLTETAGGLVRLFGGEGWETPEFVRNIVLPAGISFYIFQSLSYCIDLYRGDAVPARSLGDFACFVSLFPQLVAGPIVRYQTLADQLRSREHSPEIFAAGVARFCLGFSKKVLLADPMGGMADMAFHAGPGSLGTLAAWAGVTAYAFQIYFDFSAYSDMAIGLGRMFGFTFLENFDSPYRAASITEFWRRWHISLSTFLRDYLYIPLGGSRRGASRTYLNLFTVMLLGGLWHGAQWTFVAWGAMHGLMLAVERWLGRGKASRSKHQTPSSKHQAPGMGEQEPQSAGHGRSDGAGFRARVPRAFRIAFTFVIILITWVFFRSDDFASTGRYLSAMFSAGSLAPTAELTTASLFAEGRLFCLLACAVIVWTAWNTQYFLRRLTAWKLAACLGVFTLSLGVMFAAGHSPFIYFQF